MILDFSNFNETEEESPKIELVNTQIRKQKELEYFMKIKRNIIDLFLVDNDLLFDGKILPKSNSEPNIKKIKKKNKSNYKTIHQAKKEINFVHLNIQEEKNKIEDEKKDFNLDDEENIDDAGEVEDEVDNNENEREYSI